ncbi:hypothetical protein YUYDRAFT_01316 [Streptomyces sp. ScaeMP-e48]|nr:hypothetical protein YUYDRAFT_01316 [Streptomyces sp. ScaeMP-e48]
MNGSVSSIAAMVRSRVKAIAPEAHTVPRAMMANCWVPVRTDW